MMMKFLVIPFLLLVLISQCKPKGYEMTNVLSEEVDVYHFIEGGEYAPHYCREKLHQLVRIDPPSLSQAQLAQIRDSLDFNLDSIRADYRYSYVLTSTPVDVYIVQGNAKEMFIRTDLNGELIFPIQEDHWVHCSE